VRPTEVVLGVVPAELFFGLESVLGQIHIVPGTRHPRRHATPLAWHTTPPGVARHTCGLPRHAYGPKSVRSVMRRAACAGRMSRHRVRPVGRTEAGGASQRPFWPALTIANMKTIEGDQSEDVLDVHGRLDLGDEAIRIHGEERELRGPC
jgi:hypothetical protein